MKSTRELATIYKVNPNTMQKALKNLENDNLIYTLMTSGRYVTNDAKYIQQKKSEEVKEIICNFFSDLSHLGFTLNEIRDIISQYYD